MLFDLRRVRAFLTVAEELSFTRAAERLGIAQQQLSQSVARLEADVGGQLFTRSTRKVALTEAGASLYADLLDLLSRIEQAENKALRAARGETGRIAIGAGSYAIDSVLPEILNRFHAQYPGVGISLYEHHTAEQIDALRRGEIDVSFAIEPPDHEDLHAEAMHSGHFALVTSASEDVGTPPVRLEDFRDRSFVAAPPHLSPGLHEAKAAVFRDAGFEPNVAQYAAQTSTMLALVAAGVGLMLTPDSPRPTLRPGIRYVPLHSERRVTLAMVIRADPEPGVVLRNLCAVARAVRDEQGWPAGEGAQRAGR
jgi:DNA-binding transcriptional LysR family regulator